MVVCQCEPMRSEKGVRYLGTEVTRVGYELLAVDAGNQIWVFWESIEY